MAKITRKLMKIFGDSGNTSEFGKFGSLAAGTPTTTKDIEQIQSLANYLGGWFSAIVGSNYPAIEDMNAICYLFAYQLAYVMQTGIPEWNANTTYFIGSTVNDGFGVQYISITDNNLGNAVTDTANWKIANKKIGSSQYVVGSTAEKNLGYADYDSIATLLTDHPNNVSFLVTAAYSAAEVVTIAGTNVKMEGQGNMSSIGGLNVSSTYAVVKNLRVAGDIALTGNYNNVSDIFVNVGANTSDSGAGNKFDAIQG